MESYHEIKDAVVEGDMLVLTIDGTTRKFDLRDMSPAFNRAAKHEKETFEVSPSGYGIHWPLIDEDISIDGMLGIIHAPQSKKKTA